MCGRPSLPDKNCAWGGLLMAGSKTGSLQRPNFLSSPSPAVRTGAWRLRREVLAQTDDYKMIRNIATFPM
jgi:hypothetical protein